MKGICCRLVTDRKPVPLNQQGPVCRMTGQLPIERYKQLLLNFPETQWFVCGFLVEKTITGNIPAGIPWWLTFEYNGILRKELRTTA